MQEFVKWAQGRPEFIAVMAHSYASMAPMAYGLLTVLEDDRNFTKDGTQPDLKTWLGLYKKQRLVRNAAMGIFVDPSGFWNNDKDVFLELKNVDNSTTSEDFSELITSIFTPSNAEKLLEGYVKFHQVPREEFEKANENNVGLQRAFRPEFYFWIRVYLPCWLLYGEYPARLLRKARLGDIEALEKLLRLDSSALFDPKISKLVHSFRAYDKRRFGVIISSFSNPPKTRLTIRRVKAFFAALIISVSSFFEHRITEPEIRALYDAIAKDDGKGEIDPHIPESPHAFYMAIQREVPFWMAALSSHRK